MCDHQIHEMTSTTLQIQSGYSLIDYEFGIIYSLADSILFFMTSQKRLSYFTYDDKTGDAFEIF